MKLEKLAGATSEVWQVFIRDSSSTVGAGLAGLAFNTASLTAYYHRDTDTTATAITLVTMTVGTFTSSGFKEIDATNMPGWYQFCPPNAALASGAKSCGVHLKGATNMAPLPIEVQLVSYNPDDAVRMGMTALPNAAANAAGGLPISSAGALDLDEMNVDIEAIQTSTAGLTFTGAGKVDASVRDWVGGTIPAVNVTGVPLVDAKYLLGTIFSTPATAGIPDINVKNWVNGAVPAVNVTGVPLVDLKYTLGTISPAAAGSVRADAVTGAVGSVTGNVGGNVVGSVASVTAAVAVTSNIKKNSSSRLTFTMTDSTNHNPVTGKTVAGQVSIDGAAFGALTNTPATEISNGDYTIVLAAADTNGNALMYRFTATGCDDLNIFALTQP